MKNRGVSPLIATVILVMIVVSVGAMVMALLQDMTGSNLHQIEQKTTDIACGISVSLNIISIGGQEQLCYNDSVVQGIIENRGSEDIVGFRLTVIGDGVYSNSSVGISLTSSQTKRIQIPYDNSTSIGMRQLMLSPIIQSRDGNMVCIDRTITRQKNRLSVCPLS